MAIGGDGREVIFAGVMGESALVAPVRVHDIDFTVTVPIGGEGDASVASSE